MMESQSNWRKRTILFFCQSMYYAVRLANRSNGNRMVCDFANKQRCVGSGFFGLLLSSTIFRFIYRRRLGGSL